MGILLNPNNTDFKRAVNSKIYIDKSELINYTNSVINTEQRYICVSRPRRFGKSMAANMLTAYYSSGCKSKELFDSFKISESKNFDEHLNKYNVVHINMADYISRENVSEMISYLSRRLIHELKRENSDVDCFDWNDLTSVLEEIFNVNGIPFVFIIDEWDCIFRIHKENIEAQKAYLNFLRNLLKDKSYVALAYMTGILPIKKYGEHSAINTFYEYAMTNAAPISKFTGFTESEVKMLCETYHCDFEEMKRWYDGYYLDGESIYNPKSVVESILRGSYSNYWTSTETYEALKVYINMNYSSLRETITKMIGGENVTINTAKFQNDMSTFSSSDDVLTLLVHLGYLTFKATTETGIGEVWIPNSEVRQEFINSIEDGGWENLMKSIRASDQLLKATLNGDSTTVAEFIAQSHSENTSILQYNDENSLACVIMLAYYSAQNKYIAHREPPTGKGFADIVFIPRKNTESPAIIIELKHNKSSGTAIEQIKNKRYTEKIVQYTGDILLVGISYDDNKGHTCTIERLAKE